MHSQDAVRAARKIRASRPPIGLGAESHSGSESAPDPAEILRRQLVNRAERLDLSPALGQTVRSPASSPTPTARGSRAPAGTSGASDPLLRDKNPQEPLPLLGEGRTLEDSDLGRVRAEAPVRPASRPPPSEAERQQIQRSERTTPARSRA